MCDLKSGSEASFSPGGGHAVGGPTGGVQPGYQRRRAGTLKAEFLSLAADCGVCQGSFPMRRTAGSKTTRSGCRSAKAAASNFSRYRNAHWSSPVRLRHKSPPNRQTSAGPAVHGRNPADQNGIPEAGKTFPDQISDFPVRLRHPDGISGKTVPAADPAGSSPTGIRIPWHW